MLVIGTPPSSMSSIRHIFWQDRVGNPLFKMKTVKHSPFLVAQTRGFLKWWTCTLGAGKMSKQYRCCALVAGQGESTAVWGPLAVALRTTAPTASRSIKRPVAGTVNYSHHNASRVTWQPLYCHSENLFKWRHVTEVNGRHVAVLTYDRSEFMGDESNGTSKIPLLDQYHTDFQAIRGSFIRQGGMD